jgi:hypothetical protein
MVKSCRRILTAALAALLFMHSLSAQQGGEEPIERILDLRFYAYGSDAFAGLHYAPEPGKSEELELYPGSPSEKLPYRGPPILRLFRETPRAGLPPLRTVVAEVAIQDGLQEVLVLLVAVSADPGAYRLFACDYSSGGLPANHLAFLNLTGAPLEGLLGETPVRLGDGLSKAYSVEPYFGQRSVLVGLTVRFEESHRIVLESRTRFYPDRRTLIVLLPPEEEGSFDVVAFRIQSRAEESASPRLD